MIECFFFIRLMTIISTTTTTTYLLSLFLFLFRGARDQFAVMCMQKSMYKTRSYILYILKDTMCLYPDLIFFEMRHIMVEHKDCLKSYKYTLCSYIIVYFTKCSKKGAEKGKFQLLVSKFHTSSY